MTRTLLDKPPFWSRDVMGQETCHQLQRGPSVHGRRETSRFAIPVDYLTASSAEISEAVVCSALWTSGPVAKRKSEP